MSDQPMLFDSADTPRTYLDKAKSERIADACGEHTESDYFADWLVDHADPAEIPAIISWLEGCSFRLVVKQLRRRRAV